MSYTLSISLALGTSQVGLTLSAQLVDTTGTPVGSAITSGFGELGGGNYIWTYAGFPDGFQGGVVFSAASVVKAFCAINPTDSGALLDAPGVRSAVGLASANLDAQLATLTARLGAWAGTGVNTVLGAFKALLSKVASAPSDIGGTFDPATDSTEAIRDTPPMGTMLVGGQVAVQSPVAQSGDISLIAGDDYYDADGRALTWTEAIAASWPDLTVGATFYCGSLSVAVTVVAGTLRSVKVELSAAQTAALLSTRHFYIRAHSVAPHLATFVQGLCVCSAP